jgi:hypothetical protein
MSSSKKPIKKSTKKIETVKHEFDVTAENTLFGTPSSPTIRYYVCADHGKFPPNKMKWNGKIPICPKCGKNCSIFKE